MRRATLWLVTIMLLAAFLRFYDLKNVPPGLWADEAMNGNNAVEALRNFDISTFRVGWKVFYQENFGREGLFINIQSLFVAAFGHEPWVLRLPSAIFGVLTVLGLYFMARELFGERVALFAAFFLATSFWHIMFSRIGFRAIMAPFFLVWAFYFLFLGIRKTATSSTLGVEPARPVGGSPKTPSVFPIAVFALAGLIFGLGFHTYIAYRIAPIIALLPLWKFYQAWKIMEVEPPYGGSTSKYCAPCLIGLFVFFAFLAALPLLWYYLQNPADFLGRTSAISIFQSPSPLAQFSENFVKTLGMFNFVGDFNWRHNLAGAPQLWWPVGLLFLIGIWLSLQKIKWPESFILLWFIIMLLPVALSNESLPHALRAIVLIPPAMILAALGLEWIIAKIRNWLEKQKNTYPKKIDQLNRIGLELIILLFAFFIVTIVHAYNTYFNRWAPNFNTYQAFQTDLTEKAQWLKKDPQGIPKYVVTDAVERADLRGTPMSFQPIIFIAGAKNIEYLGAGEFGKIDCSNKCVIVPVESRPTIYKTLKQKIPGLRLDASPGFVILRK